MELEGSLEAILTIQSRHRLYWQEIEYEIWEIQTTTDLIYGMETDDEKNEAEKEEQEESDLGAEDMVEDEENMVEDEEGEQPTSDWAEMYVVKKEHVHQE